MIIVALPWRGGELKAGALRQHQIAILHLHGRMRFAAQLPNRLEHFRHAAAVSRMIVAQTAAVGVERQLADAGDQIAVGDEFPARSLGAETEILELHDHGDGEAVVDRGVFDIRGRHTCFGKGDRAGARCARCGEIESAARQMLDGLAGTDDLHKRPLQLFGDLRADENNRATAVADDAAIEPVQRIGDQ
jgi:hypothetical protein